MRGERHNHSMRTFPSAPHHVRPLSQTTDLVSASFESQPSSSQARTQLTDFSQIPQILWARFRCMTSFNSPGLISIWDFYFDISEGHILPACAWTPAHMLHLTNPCAKRKVLSLTKTKGKIYKTKSLGHYITLISRSFLVGLFLSRRIQLPKLTRLFFYYLGNGYCAGQQHCGEGVRTPVALLHSLSD